MGTIMAMTATVIRIMREPATGLERSVFACADHADRLRRGAVPGLDLLPSGREGAVYPVGPSARVPCDLCREES